MEPVLLNHQASKDVKEKAEAAGIDLEVLKTSKPQDYKMLNAQYLLELDEPFLENVSSVFFAIFPYYELFQVPQDSFLHLYAFPSLSKPELDKLELALGRLTEQANFVSQDVFFRVITDKQGIHRQFRSALAPQNWHGQMNRLVGPFKDQLEAESWGKKARGSAELIVDAVPLKGVWFCDVFSA